MASNHTMRCGAQPTRTTPTLSSREEIREAGRRLIAPRVAAEQFSTAVRRTLLPRRAYVPPVPIDEIVIDDPMLGTRGAAIILGISIQLLKKRRQRNQGPDYYQFGPKGPVVYTLSQLNAFKATHLVVTRKKGRK